MTKSYKIPTLLSFIKDDEMKSKVDVEDIGKIFMNYYIEDEIHQKDLNDKKHKNWKDWDIDRFTDEAIKNPIKYLCRSDFFNYDDINQIFYINKELRPFIDNNLKAHFLDIVRYKEKEYFEGKKY